MIPVKQTGLKIVLPTARDYITGSFTAIPEQVRLESGSWDQYLPKPEAQSALTFDTLSCTTFSALNVIETQINFMIKEKILSNDQIVKLDALGFFKDGDFKFNASDRFISIISGTTKEGNDFKTVVECIRKNGLLPEADLPFGGSSFEEYVKPSLITDSMRAKALKFLEIFNVQYEWLFFDNDPRFSDVDVNTTTKALKQAPAQIAIPLPAKHATMLYAINTGVDFSTFDQYYPFYFKDVWETPIHFAMKIYVTPKLQEPFIFTKDLYLGVRDPEVAELQKRLNQFIDTRVADTGPGSIGNETVIFGKLTHDAVKRYQKKYFINPISGYVGRITRNMLNGVISTTTTPHASKMDAWCEATKVHEGWITPQDENPQYPNGSISYKNNNPGNIKYVGQKRAIGKSGPFCVFATYEDGYQELKDMLTRACLGRSANYDPEMTLLEFYAGGTVNGKFYPGYAPSSDSNNPTSYAQAVAKRIGVEINTQIKTLL